MIINIRGTGGAGKSTLVRSIMSRYPERIPHVVTGRKQPVGYLCRRPGSKSLWVVGHYETACGGADTIKTPDEVYQSIQAYASETCDVVFEGIITQDDVRRCLELAAAGHHMIVLALEVPIETCLASIQARRDARGDTRALNPKNTRDRARRLVGTIGRLKSAGVSTEWVTREQALEVCSRLLVLGNQEYNHTAATATEATADDIFELR